MVRIILLLFACLFIIFQHSYYLKDRYYNRDIAGYAYNTSEVMQGRGWYTSTWHSKPPGSSFLYMLAFYMFGKSFIAVRLLIILTDILSAVLLYFLGKYLLCENTWLASLLPVFWVLFCVSVDSSAHGTNLETLVAFFEIAGILFISLAYKDKVNVFYFVSGIMLGCGFMIKQSALITFAACLIFMIFNQMNNKESIISWDKRILIFAVSFLTPLMILSIYFLSQGVFDKFMQYSFIVPWQHGENILPGARFMGEIIKMFNSLGVELTIFGALALAGIIYILINKLNSMYLFLIWFTLCFILALVSPYEHYLVQLIAPLVCLSLVGFSWIYKISARSKTLRAIFIILLITPYVHTIFLLEKGKSVVSLPSEQRYLVSQYIKSKASPQDKIFVWDDVDGCAIYFWTGLQNVSHFRQKCSFLPYKLVRYYQRAFVGDYKLNQKSLLSDMGQGLPAYIVIADDKVIKLTLEKKAFKEFFHILDNQYKVEKRMDNFNIYRLIPMCVYDASIPEFHAKASHFNIAALKAP